MSLFDQCTIPFDLSAVLELVLGLHQYGVPVKTNFGGVLLLTFVQFIQPLRAL